MEKDSSKPASLTSEGIKLYEEKKYKEALNIMEEALKVDREFGKAWFYKGLILKELGKEREAIKAITSGEELKYLKITEQTLKFLKIDEILGTEKLTPLQEQELSEKEFDDKLKKLLFTQKNIEKIKKYSEDDYIDLRYDVLQEKIILHINLGHYIDAINTYSFLEKNNIDVSKFKNQINELENKPFVKSAIEGENYFKEREFEKAIIYFKKSLQDNPKDKRVYIFLGEALEKTDKYKEAFEAFSRAEEEGETGCHIIYHEAINLYKIRDYKKARDYFEKIKHIQPDYKDTEKMIEECNNVVSGSFSIGMSFLDQIEAFVNNIRKTRKIAFVGLFLIVLYGIFLAGSWWHEKNKIKAGLDSNDPVERIGSIRKLSSKKDMDAFNKILQISKSDPVEQVRGVAALCLINYKSCEVDIVSPLLQSLGDPSANVRKMAIQALVKLKGDKVFEGLCKLLKDSNMIIRKSAARALGDLKDKKALPLLEEAMKNEQDETVKDEMFKAIAKLNI